MFEFPHCLYIPSLSELSTNIIIQKVPITNFFLPSFWFLFADLWNVKKKQQRTDLICFLIKFYWYNNKTNFSYFFTYYIYRERMINVPY